MFPTWSPNDPGPGLTLQCSGLLDPSPAHPSLTLPRKQVENKQGESGLETPPPVVAAGTGGLLGPSEPELRLGLPAGKGSLSAPASSLTPYC